MASLKEGRDTTKRASDLPEQENILTTCFDNNNSFDYFLVKKKKKQNP